MNFLFLVVVLPCLPFPSVRWARFWHSMLQFMTGPRRHASRILTIPKSDLGNPKIMRFLHPHVGGDDNFIVEETPAEGVHVEDADLGEYLDEIN